MLLSLHFGRALSAFFLLGHPCAAIIWQPQATFLAGMFTDCSSTDSQEIQNAVTYVNTMAQDALRNIDANFPNGAVPSNGRTAISTFYQWFFNDQDAKDLQKYRTYLQRILDTGPDAVKLTVHCGDAYAAYLIKNGWTSKDFRFCAGNTHYAQAATYTRINGMFSSSVQPDGRHLYLCPSWGAAKAVESLPNKVLGDYVGTDNDNQDRSFMLLHEAFHVVSENKVAPGYNGPEVSDPSYGWEGCTFLAEQGVQTNAANPDKSSLRPIDNADSMALFTQALSTLRNRNNFQWGRNGYAKARQFDWIRANRPLDRYPGNLQDAHRGSDDDVEMLPA